MSRHAHPCASCGRAVPCDGERESNPDGWPDVICHVYNLPGGALADVRCEDCASPREAAAV